MNANKRYRKWVSSFIKDPKLINFRPVEPIIKKMFLGKEKIVGVVIESLITHQRYTIQNFHFNFDEIKINLSNLIVNKMVKNTDGEKNSVWGGFNNILNCKRDFEAINS